MATVAAQTWLEQPAASLPGAGRLTKALSALGIETVRDLLEHYPHAGKYRDIGAQLPARDAPLGEPVTLVGTISSWQLVRPRGRKLTIAKAKLRDDLGGVVEIALFNQDWRIKAQPAGTRVAASGVLERFRSTLQLRNAKIAVLGDEEQFDDSDRIVATYPATEALPSARLASLVAAALDELPPLEDFLPVELRRRHDLLDLNQALRGSTAPLT